MKDYVEIIIETIIPCLVELAVISLFAYVACWSFSYPWSFKLSLGIYVICQLIYIAFRGLNNTHHLK